VVSPFADSMADQLVVVASTVTLMSIHVVGILPGSVYIVAYTVVMLFAMARNALSVPYSWLVRPSAPCTHVGVPASLRLRKRMPRHCLAADGTSARVLPQGDGTSARVLPQAAVPAAAKRATLIL